VFDSSSVRVKDNIMGDVLLQTSSSSPGYIVPVPVSPVPEPTNVVLIEFGNL